ncbi:hypothetical protein T265_05796 [Opisthorchis viverrini]|uniref:Uncharacterized protein n=1 Tax=Opisthorchis viverrini TaxID=6198 RepID=A0A074ZIG6_OPIVI|nr:hypothetical protein T265_05796 [Opisthorchis viverrini]KER27103.1 hypothetical protein T265_05796 [Opisthorchis viverrini]
MIDGKHLSLHLPTKPAGNTGSARVAVMHHQVIREGELSQVAVGLKSMVYKFSIRTSKDLYDYCVRAFSVDLDSISLMDCDELNDPALVLGVQADSEVDRSTQYHGGNQDVRSRRSSVPEAMMTTQYNWSRG